MHWWYEFKEQLDAEREQWHLWYPVAFALGIGFYFLLPSEPSKWVTLGGVELLVIIAILLRHYPSALRALVLPALIVFGFASIQIRSIYLSSFQYQIPEGVQYIKGRITRMDYNSQGRQRLVLDGLSNFDNKKIGGAFRISLRSQQEELHSGQCIEAVVRLMPRARSVIPKGYQFDRKSFYLGLSGSGYAISRAIPIDCPDAADFWEKVDYFIDYMRQSAVLHIKKILPPEEASVAAAIISGEQGGVKQKIMSNYRDSGLAHFLSISGLHMSMIAGLMFFFIRFSAALIPPVTLRYNIKKAAAVSAIVVSMVYLMISGAAIPAQRAFIMTLVVLLGVLFDRRAISMQTLSIAAFAVLLISPEALIGASFQMSFAAAVALVAFYEKFSAPLQRFFNGKGRQPWFLRGIKTIVVYILGILIADMVASLATLPFAIYHFNRVALFTTMANLMAGPIIGLLIMPFTLFALLLMPLGMDSGCLQVMGYGIGLVNQITHWVSGFPHAALTVLSMPLWGLLLIVFGGLWMAIWKTKWRIRGVWLIVAGLASLLVVKNPDVLADSYGNVFAVKDENGKMVVLPSVGKSFIKEVWLSKTASPVLTDKQKDLVENIFQGQQTDKDWLDLECDDKTCIYKKRVVISKDGNLMVDGKSQNLLENQGSAIFLKNKGFEVMSVRKNIGKRLWNTPKDE